MRGAVAFNERPQATSRGGQGDKHSKLIPSLPSSNFLTGSPVGKCNESQGARLSSWGRKQDGERWKVDLEEQMACSIGTQYTFVESDYYYMYVDNFFFLFSHFISSQVATLVSIDSFYDPCEFNFPLLLCYRNTYTNIKKTIVLY